MELSRIIHVPRRFVTDEWGGTETVVSSLALEQSRLGFKPEIHTSLALSRERSEMWEDIPVRRYPYCYPFFGLNAAEKAQMDKKGGNLLSLRLFTALARMKDARIYHAHALKRLGGEVFTAARIRRRPFVVTLHGGVFDVPQAELTQMMEAQKGKFEWGRAAGALFCSRRILEESDAVICVGRSEYEHAKKSLPHDRIYHLGNGVDAGRFARGDGAAFRAQYNLPADALVVACYSRLDPQKDQMTLLTAFEALAAEFPKLHLVIAGPVTVPSFAAEIDARIAQSPHGSRVRRLDALPFSDGTLVDAYHACDIFALPSRHEPFGIVVLEAWSAGKPVVVSHVGGLQDLVEEDVDGLFFPAGDDGACARQLRRVLADAALRHSLGDRGQRKARATYSWSRLAEQTEQIYRQAEVHAAVGR